MSLFPPVLLLIGLISCSPVEKRPSGSIPGDQSVQVATINYDSCKKAVLILKSQNKQVWNKLSKQEKEKLFTESVTETIIPAWIGTPWSFNGTSETPQQGSIACGYFVTTVLRDAGLTLHRIKLAQCASEQMITTLVQSKHIRRFSNISLENFIHTIEESGYGLYIVGLDNHTGFLYNDGNKIYFIHSTFVGTRNVQKEKASTCWILRQSRYKVLGKLSADEKVLEKWMN